MRKQVQKERCTKIMLTKCKAVCCLYDKVQLAAAKMLDAEPAIFQFECNVPILCNDIPANDLNLPSETYTTDFVLHYGEPYWHRSHQLPDMQICTKHRCWLVDTDVTYNSARQQELFPATFTMRLKKQPAEPVPGCLLALDLLLQDTLDSSFDYRDGSVYHAVLDRALRSRGWRSLTGGRTYATKIETALLSLYGNYIPTADISAKQLHATLCSKSVAPRYVLQLAVLLELSLNDLLHTPDAVPDYKAEMKAMYQSGASMYHIAQLYGIDAKTVARWIKS